MKNKPLLLFIFQFIIYVVLVLITHFSFANTHNSTELHSQATRENKFVILDIEIDQKIYFVNRTVLANIKLE